MQTGLARIGLEKSLFFTKNQLESAHEKSLSEKRLQIYIQSHHRVVDGSLCSPNRPRERERERERERYDNEEFVLIIFFLKV